MSALVDALFTRAKEQINYIDHDLLDQNTLSNHLYARIHSVATGALEAFGALVGALSLVPKAGALLVGEALYLPVRVWNLISSLSKGLRDYSSDFYATLCKTVRLGVGAATSTTVGVVHPRWNNRIHQQLLFKPCGCCAYPS